MEPRLELAVEHVVHQRALARSGDAGHRGEGAQRNVGVHVLRGCAAWPRGSRATAARRGRRTLGTPMRFCPVRYCPVSESAALVDRAGVHHLAAVLSRAGPSSSMKSACRIAARSCSTTTTVLPCVAQPAQQAQQPVGVPRVQADGRLVQHVERVHQAGAERVGQRDALGLAAGEGAGLAVEREVAQARHRAGSSSRASSCSRMSCATARSEGAERELCSQCVQLVDRAAADRGDGVARRSGPTAPRG